VSPILLIDNTKIGSEWWLLFLLNSVWRIDDDIIVAGQSDLPHLPSSCVWDVALVDDVLFSGQHLMGIMDEFLNNTRESESQVNFHLVVPFVSKVGIKTIESLKEVYPKRILSINFYPVAQIHTIRELFACYGLTFGKIQSLADAKGISFDPNQCPVIEYLTK
jgi:hypothetical protein